MSIECERPEGGDLSFLPWVRSISVTGRMIAYNWFDCDKQPQPSIVNRAAGCVVADAR